jgi:hypothetical protein
MRKAYWWDCVHKITLKTTIESSMFKCYHNLFIFKHWIYEQVVDSMNPSWSIENHQDPLDLWRANGAIQIHQKLSGSFKILSKFIRIHKNLFKAGSIRLCNLVSLKQTISSSWFLELRKLREKKPKQSFEDLRGNNSHLLILCFISYQNCNW